MYASIRQYRLDADEYRRLMPRIKAELLPRLEQIEGFVNYRIWLDDAGHVVSASTFADRAGCQRSDEVAAEMYHELVGGMVIELLSADIGEIVLTHPPMQPPG